MTTKRASLTKRATATVGAGRSTRRGDRDDRRPTSTEIVTTARFAADEDRDEDEELRDRKERRERQSQNRESERDIEEVRERDRDRLKRDLLEKALLKVRRPEEEEDDDDLDDIEDIEDDDDEDKR